MNFEKDPGQNHECGLHICPECDSDLVQPTQWETSGDRSSWKVWLRCPECEWRDEGIFEQGELDEFDDYLDDATAQLSKTAAEFTRDVMATEADILSRAFDADLLTADDFRG